jgi:branched-chain amino acid aminotransferase
VLTHSLHYGLSALEGVRIYDGRRGPALFRLPEHTRRLMGSAHVYGMDLPFDRERLLSGQCEAVRANRLKSGYLRTLAFYGAEKLGLSPIGARVHVVAAAFEWGPYLGSDALTRGVRVKTSSFARSPSHAAPPRAKIAAQYANSILAHREAVAEGYDEALLLDTRGLVAEGPGENVFVVRDGVLYEPSPTSALAGITRDTLRTLARDLGLAVVTGDLTRDDVYLADEAFFTGTATEIAPIIELDRRRIGDGKPGPITRRLVASYEAATRGEDERYGDWLTPVGAA